jgi:hypothetical protein
MKLSSIFFTFFIGLVDISYQKDDCDKPDLCSLAPEPGPCEAIFTKYYFDKEAKKCKEFSWGGCDGVVPFETLEAFWECECSKRLE